MAEETQVSAAAAAAPETQQAAPQENGATAGTQVETAQQTYTQKDVDRLIGERLQRERVNAEKAAQKEREAAERKAAEQQGEYQKLYETAQAKLAAAESEAHELRLGQLRRAAADKVGLPAALADRLRGENEAELEADAKAVFAALPKPVAPNINNGQGGQAAQTIGGMDEAQRREYAARLGVQAKYFKPSGS